MSRIMDTLFGTMINLFISFSAYCFADRFLVGFNANSMLMYGTWKIATDITSLQTATNGWHNPPLSTAGFIFIIVFGLLMKWDAHYIADTREIKQEFDMLGLMKNIITATENTPDAEQQAEEDEEEEDV